MSRTNTLIVAGLVVGWLSNSPRAEAAINYGDFMGNTVVYTDVTEESLTDALPLYGAPTISGNTLDFNPVGLGASASGGSFDFTDGQLDFGIQALGGNTIPAIAFSENGDFDLGGVGTAATFVSVAATFFIDVVAVDGVPLSIPQLTATMAFVPGGTMTLPAYPGIGQLWSGSLGINVNQWLTDNGVSFVLGATQIKVNLDNKLAAFSEDGSVAYIAKKDFKGIGITVPEVPEPSVFAIALVGAGLCLARRKTQ